MTSLPIPVLPDRIAPGPAGLSLHQIGNPGLADEQFLLRAFRSFSEAAATLEASYGSLRGEVERLRRELEASNRDLAVSLEENRSIRSHLDRILETIPCGVLALAGDQSVSLMNPEARRMIAAASDTGLESVSSFPLLPAKIRELLESARRSGEECETGMDGDDGECVRWLAARHAPMEAPRNESVFILRDIGERKRLEQMQAKLYRDQALAEMSAILAHEVRNPLGSLELFAGLLQDSELDAECRQWVERIQAGLRTLSATVNNVLHFYCLAEPARAPVDLGSLLDWAQAFFTPLTRQDHIVLSLQNRLHGVRLQADRHRLEQVLLNLILNSVRAAGEGGWIELRGHEIPAEDGGGFVLAVADNGPGISAGDLPRIFDAGFSTHAGGSGLGLAVCRRIVEQHGGTISAASDCGLATTFTLRFPTCVEAPPEVFL